MPRRVPPIARIRLARSLPRLLAWPALAIVTGVMAMATWFVGSFGTGVGGIVFAVLGGTLVLAGLVAAIVLLSVRLDVEEAAVRLSWLGGERTYLLAPGPVTRVRLRGEDASRLRSRLGIFGWAIGPARLRDAEEIHVVRLARTPTAILVPTERGRLAIAPANEADLLDALTRAARARQRLDEIVGRARLVAGARPVERADEQAQPVEQAGEPEPAMGSVEVEPHVLTGIERALIEQRLAEERAAAQAVAAERSAAAAAGGGVVEPPVAVPSTIDREPEPEIRPERAPRRRRYALRRPGSSAASIVLPLLGAGVAWSVGIVNDTYPEPGTDLDRLTSLALVLAGPATSVGAVMARTWWPRLVGVVVAGGLAASLFIGRALVGG